MTISTVLIAPTGLPEQLRINNLYDLGVSIFGWKVGWAAEAALQPVGLDGPTSVGGLGGPPALAD